MNTPTTSILLSLSLSILAGCGEPCGLPNVRPGIVLAAEECPIGEESSSSEADSSSSGASASETTGGEASSTGETPTAESTGDDTGMLPTCIAVPGAGEFWGPCFVGATCTEGICHDGGGGNVCLASCEDGQCEPFKCFGGFCTSDDRCVPKCSTSDDCPIDGTFCLDEICVYPAFAPKP